MRVGGLLPVPSGRAPNSEVADARALPAGPRLSRCLLPVPAECRRGRGYLAGVTRPQQVTLWNFAPLLTPTRFQQPTDPSERPPKSHVGMASLCWARGGGGHCPAPSAPPSSARVAARLPGAPGSLLVCACPRGLAARSFALMLPGRQTFFDLSHSELVSVTH